MKNSKPILFCLRLVITKVDCYPTFHFFALKLFKLESLSHSVLPLLLYGSSEVITEGFFRMA